MEKRFAKKKTRKHLSGIFAAALNPFSNRRFIFFPVLFSRAAAYGQAPNISYNSPQVLYMEMPVSISPTNTGWPVSDPPGITYATEFNEPYGIAADSAGNLYAADFFTQAIKKTRRGVAPLNIAIGL